LHSSRETSNECHKKKDQENKKQNFSEARGCRDAGEAEHCRYNGYKKNAVAHRGHFGTSTLRAGQ
jgi:hypothetical protein